MKYQFNLLLLVILAFSCSNAEETSPLETDEFAEAKTIYATNCASCHGQKVEMFVDRKWKHGNTIDSISSSIKGGYLDLGMPSFDSIIPDEQISKLALFIKNGIDNRDSYTFENKFNPDSLFEADGLKFRLELITDEIEVPWGYVFLPDNSMLITNKNGKLMYRATDGELSEISGVPKVQDEGQGGLLDIELDPAFATNKTIYLSYTKPKDGESTTAVSKAIFDGKSLANVAEIFEALPYLSTKHHYGGRLEFDVDNHLFITVGDRGKRDENPQSLENHCGKIHRINPDGSIPDDNPFVDTENAIKSIYSYGHRNPQGLKFDAKTNTMWEHEHGPRGGDELNIIVKGENYGWPLVSLGINYNGTTFTNKTEMEGMKNAEKYWVPSIAPCGMDMVQSDKYPGWENQLLIGSLRFKYVTKVSADMSETQLLENIGRVRNIRLDREGYIYVSTEADGAIYKLIPE